MALAAVLPGVNQQLEVYRGIEVESPRAGEVKISVAASGVCHSDLSVANGTIRLPTPIVLGHEGAGVVTEVGEGVTDLQPGDHVVLSFVPSCGRCYFCARGQGNLCEKGALAAMGGLVDGSTRLTHDGSALFQMAMCGTYANEAIVPEISTVKIGHDVPLKLAALIGCGVLTGVGAALNTANIRRGDAVAVIGCGGVGLNVIQGARIAGAERIIGIDVFDSKLDLAKQFGATDVIRADEDDVMHGVRALTGGRGADVAFEVIGRGTTMDQAIRMVRNGGEAVLVGVPEMDVFLNLRASTTFIYTGKTVKGCWYGSSNVRHDVPKLLDLWRNGQLQLERLISREIGVDGVNEAFHAMESGAVARSVIIHQH